MRKKDVTEKYIGGLKDIGLCFVSCLVDIRAFILLFLKIYMFYTL